MKLANSRHTEHIQRSQKIGYSLPLDMRKQKSLKITPHTHNICCAKLVILEIPSDLHHPPNHKPLIFGSKLDLLKRYIVQWKLHNLKLEDYKTIFMHSSHLLTNFMKYMNC
jgi:hypothetical protein